MNQPKLDWIQLALGFVLGICMSAYMAIVINQIIEAVK